jgi:hypothetical protein
MCRDQRRVAGAHIDAGADDPTAGVPVSGSTVPSTIVVMDADDLAALARAAGVSPVELRDALERGSGPVPTLTDFVHTIDADLNRPLAHRYPQGRRYLLEGIAGHGATPAVHGLGSRPCTQFTLRVVQDHIAAVRRVVAARKAASAGPHVITDPRGHGAGAEEQCVRAARIISLALVEAGWFARDPLAQLHTPRRRGPARDTALTDHELRDWARILLMTSDDPELDALLWCLLRVTALRPRLLLEVPLAALKVDRPGLTGLLKGGGLIECPVHRPLLEAVLRVMSSRSAPADVASLMTTTRGHPVTRRRYNTWSVHLKQHAPWASGHEIGPRFLRATAARAVTAAGGANSVAGALYLGHEPHGDLGTIAAYLHTPHIDDWSLKSELAARVFGPLDRWPILVEAEELGLVLPRLRPPSVQGQPALGERAGRPRPDRAGDPAAVSHPHSRCAAPRRHWRSA